MLRPYAVVLLGLVVSACSARPAPVVAQQPEEAPRTLTVHARASVARAPDRATVQLAVETLAESARDATDGNAAAMAAVLAALDALGIPRAAIRTERISLNPRYDQRPNVARPEIVGYHAMNQVAVQVDGIDRVGAVVDAAVGAGANRLTGLRFELSDPEAAYHEALERAIAQARREAEAAAAALHETLGPPLTVSTGGFDAPTPSGPAPEVIQLRGASSSVEPGELEVRANVSITFRLGS